MQFIIKISLSSSCYNQSPVKKVMIFDRNFFSCYQYENDEKKKIESFSLFFASSNKLHNS